jgi:lipopolysaccharide/colanic/teichoic acid biosynthesis glycosyltransferase
MIPQRPLWQNVIERMIAFLIVVLLLPLFCIIAALVKLTSPGTCLSQQKYLGLNGSLFYLYRFRATAADNLTWVGHFLRQYALEGMPQLWNVMAGDLRLREIEGIRVK